MSEVALLIQEIKDMEYGKGSTDHDRKNPTDLERNACLVLAYKLGWVVQGRRNSEIAALAVKKISIVNGYTCSFVTDPIECIRRWADDDKLQLTLGSPDAGKPGPKSMLDIHDNLTIMRHYRAAVNEITDEASWDDFVEQMNKQGLAYYVPEVTYVEDRAKFLSDQQQQRQMQMDESKAESEEESDGGESDGDDAVIETWGENEGLYIN
jgi:hypothetical protein